MYIIFYYKVTSLGLIKQFLSIDGSFYTATKTPKYFKTRNEAYEAYKNESFQSPIASQCFIEGPNKGVYSIQGRYLRN